MFFHYSAIQFLIHLANNIPDTESPSVIQQESSGKYSLIENFPTREGARTIITDVTSHKIYLPVAEREKGSGTAKPDSFSVIEIEPAQK